MERTRKTLQRGISLFELFTVIGLITLILLVSMPELYRWYQNYKIQTTISEIAVHLRFARNAAVKQKKLYRVTFTVNSGKDDYRVEYSNDNGGSYLPAAQFGLIKLPDTVDLQGNATVVFNLRGGATATNWPLLVNGANNSHYSIQVSQAGAISTTKISGG